MYYSNYNFQATPPGPRGSALKNRTPCSSFSRVLSPYRAFLTFRHISPYNHPVNKNISKWMYVRMMLRLRPPTIYQWTCIVWWLFISITCPLQHLYFPHSHFYEALELHTITRTPTKSYNYVKKREKRPHITGKLQNLSETSWFAGVFCLVLCCSKAGQH